MSTYNIHFHDKIRKKKIPEISHSYLSTKTYFRQHILVESNDIEVHFQLVLVSLNV